jgi:hypothetical protein
MKPVPALEHPASLEPADLLDFAREGPGLVPRQQRREREHMAAKSDRRAQEQARVTAGPTANAARQQATTVICR